MKELLLESEGLYRNLVRILPDAIALVDINMNIVIVNRPFVILYGYDCNKKMDGKKIFDFVVPEEWPKLIEIKKRY